MFKNILVSVDTSEHSRKVVTTTQELAKSLGAEVHVLHVRELVSTGRGGPQDLDFHQDEHNIAQEVCQKLQESGIVATFDRTSSYHGDTGRVIVTAAKERSADLIVVGSRGHSEVLSVLLGSVTNKIMHLAECAVLVVR